MDRTEIHLLPGAAPAADDDTTTNDNGYNND